MFFILSSFAHNYVQLQEFDYFKALKRCMTVWDDTLFAHKYN